MYATGWLVVVLFARPATNPPLTGGKCLKIRLIDISIYEVKLLFYEVRLWDGVGILKGFMSFCWKLG